MGKQNWQSRIGSLIAGRFSKFMLGFGCLLALLIGVSSFGIYSLSNVSDHMDTYSLAVEEATDVARLEATFLKIAVSAKEYLLTKENKYGETADEYTEQWRARKKQAEMTITNPQDLVDLKNLSDQFEDYIDTFSKIRNAKSDIPPELRQKLALLRAEITANSEALIERVVGVETRVRQEIDKEIEIAEIEMLVAALLGLLVGVYVALRREKESISELRQINRKLEDEVSVRIGAERSLENMVKNLERSNSDLEKFAYVASHDLQEPLRKVQAFGDLLASDCADDVSDEAKDYIARMQSAAQRMRVLIDDLLSYSRVAQKRRVFEPTDLNQVVKEVVDDLEISLNEAGGTISISEFPVIDGDPTQLHQLFQNILGNGIKYRRPDVAPVISCTAKVTDQVCEITVSDNGIGFENTHKDKIFEIFQRLHGRNSFSGSGIGLSICRKICERHDGYISADGHPGEGAVFKIVLPIKQVSQQKEAA